jgi:hypothetical protein
MQEIYLMNWWGHYRNGIAPMPVLEWPQWIKEGVSYLSHYYSIDSERESKENMKKFNASRGAS